MKWVKNEERKPEGVTSFKTMSEWVAVKYYSKYDRKIITVCGRFCHDRCSWFVSGGCDGNIYNKSVIEWLDETA